MQIDAGLGSYGRALVEVASPAEVTASVARALAERADFPAWDRLALSGLHAGSAAPAPPPEATHDWLGPIYEARLDASVRRTRGAHFTPPGVARALAAVGTDGLSSTADVFDPAVGGGAFLVAAASRLVALGADPASVVVDQLWGLDVDPVGVAVAEAVLALWAWQWGTVAIAGDHLGTGDALGPTRAFGGRRFDLVVGNPPFRGQLAAATARDRSRAEALSERFGEAARGYVDDAGLFVLAALDQCRARGRIVLIQPASVLSAASAAPIRCHVADRAALVGLWSASDVFDAAVDVCAVIIEPTPTISGVRVLQGTDADLPSGPVVARPGPERWATLLADDVPAVEVRPGPVLGDLATATAGFRDQHYGLAPYAVDDPADQRTGLPRLVNVGLIEPLACEWGQRPVRFAKRRWERPRVDVEALRAADPRLAAWVDARLEPKVVVATQTKVIEAALDDLGEWVPTTPAISVHCAPADLGPVVAVLLAPPLSAWARRIYGGAGLSADAIKVAAKQLLDLPLPDDRALWREAAELVADPGDRPPGRHDRLLGIGRLMTRAYGEPESVFEWWRTRLREPKG